MPDEPVPPPQDWMLPISEEDPGLAGLSVVPEAVREPGPPRCACGYLLGGLVEKGGLARCPECGKEQWADGSSLNSNVRQDDRPLWVVLFFILIFVIGLVQFQIAYSGRPRLALGAFTIGGILGAFQKMVSHVMSRRAYTRRALRWSRSPGNVQLVFVLILGSCALLPYGRVLFYGLGSGYLCGFIPYILIVHRGRVPRRHRV